MTEKEANDLRAQNTALRQQIDKLEAEIERLKNSASPAITSPPNLVDDVYQCILARLLKEPAIIELRTAKPEIRLSETRETVELDGKTLRGRLARLIHDGYFDDPRNGNSAFNELKRVGFGTAKPNVYRELDALASMGFLTKESAGYQTVPDMKRNIVRA